MELYFVYFETSPVTEAVINIPSAADRKGLEALICGLHWNFTVGFTHLALNQ